MTQADTIRKALEKRISLDVILDACRECAVSVKADPSTLLLTFPDGSEVEIPIALRETAQ